MFPEELFLPDVPDLSFPGFSQQAFDLLESLRQHPHIEQYRKIKPELDRYLIEPFKQYRDDVVLNLVLPNRLPLETERNVFSRLLKNDFGAGGCHHHLWMSFYRPGRKRLNDLQLPHSIDPDGFTIGIYTGHHAPDVLGHVIKVIYERPAEFNSLINPLLAENWILNYDVGTGTGKQEHDLSEPLTGLPDDLRRASGIWIHTMFPREQVIEWKSGLVGHALHAVRDVWPLYRLLL